MGRIPCMDYVLFVIAPVIYSTPALVGACVCLWLHMHRLRAHMQQLSRKSSKKMLVIFVGTKVIGFWTIWLGCHVAVPDTRTSAECFDVISAHGASLTDRALSICQMQSAIFLMRIREVAPLLAASNCRSAGIAGFDPASSCGWHTVRHVHLLFHPICHLILAANSARAHFYSLIGLHATSAEPHSSIALFAHEAPSLLALSLTWTTLSNVMSLLIGRDVTLHTLFIRWPG